MAIIILSVVGIVLAANLLVDNRELSSIQRAQVVTACPACHGSVPTYSVALRVHDKHSTLDCSRCHRDDRGVEIVDSFHRGLSWLGIGTIALALTGIVTNSLVLSKRKEAR